MGAQPKTNNISRRRFLNTAAVASGLGLSGVIGGMGYVAMRSPEGRNGKTFVEAADNMSGMQAQSAPAFAVGPQINGQVTDPRPAALAPASNDPVKNIVMSCSLKTLEVAGGGVMYNAWTFEGSVPGPVLHVRQGDTVNFTFNNNASGAHSIDLHAAQIAPNVAYKTIMPGESISFQFSANFPGVFMYHCGAAPMLDHIANGMYGAIVVDPEQALAPAREYVLVQSEIYGKLGDNGTFDGDMDKMLAVRPDLMAFNGIALQYKDNPLPASVNERIRLYVVNAGPTLFSAFHVVGALFDRVLVDGNPANVLRGVQTYTVPPGGGSTFELVIPAPGQYPFVTHTFGYTELGAVGVLNVA